jgi:hypothetical protein
VWGGGGGGGGEEEKKIISRSFLKQRDINS